MSGSAAPPPWHFSSAEEMAPYLPWLLEHFDHDLPLVDVGCGDGVLTRQLACHFRAVFEVDVSPAAVAKARREHVLANVDYEQLDATDIAGARRLQARLGDANLHLRGVLHAMTAADWPTALATLAILTGKGGRVIWRAVGSP